MNGSLSSYCVRSVTTSRPCVHVVAVIEIPGRVLTNHQNDACKFHLAPGGLELRCLILSTTLAMSFSSPVLPPSWTVSALLSSATHRSIFVLMGTHPERSHPYTLMEVNGFLHISSFPRTLESFC